MKPVCIVPDFIRCLHITYICKSIFFNQWLNQFFQTLLRNPLGTHKAIMTSLLYLFILWWSFSKTCHIYLIAYEWSYLTRFFVTICLSKSFWESPLIKKSYQRVQMLDILLKYILWYAFLNDLDDQSDFGKKIFTKKPVK